MTELHIPTRRTVPEPPTWDAYEAASRAVEKHRARADTAEALLENLRDRATAVAAEYDREPRLIASGAVASMLREWVQAR